MHINEKDKKRVSDRFRFIYFLVGWMEGIIIERQDEEGVFFYFLCVVSRVHLNILFLCSNCTTFILLTTFVNHLLPSIMCIYNSVKQ